MKVKRFLAIVLAVTLAMSSLMAGASVSAVETGSVSGTSAADSNIASADKTADSTQDASTAAADSTGVINGEDAYDADLEPVSGETTASATIQEVDRSEIDVDLTTGGTTDNALTEAQPYADEDMVKVIIEFCGDCVIEGNSDAQLGSVLTTYKINMLEKAQASAIAQIESEVLGGESLSVAYSYTWLINGVAAEVPYGTISQIEALSCVEKVYLQRQYEALDSTDTSDTLSYSSGTMIGKSDAWDLGYTGEGITIAIIDTGLDTDHPNFAALAEDVETSADADTIAAVLDSLNAASRYEGLTVDDVYYSTKIAFGFNYCDDDLNITHDYDSQGDHGTHVAGITAANAVEGSDVVGVAPDAQLYIMKVFGANGGAYTEDILAALEDALMLGADVVNMSLGSSAGFSVSGDAAEDAVYARIAETNTVLAVAAGNAATVGSGNLTGTESTTTSNPDNGVVSSPSTYANAISVASVENCGIVDYYIESDGTKLFYTEGQNGGNDAISTLYGGTYEFAVVDNMGQTLEDFLNADVEGKIAVVSRGVTTFASKCELAEEAGAIACLVYDNVTYNENFVADLSDTTATIPFATITKSAGEYLVSVAEAAAEAGTVPQIYVSDSDALVENPLGYQMNAFSSWGTTTSLAIEPDITAPGGDIYSTLDGGTYGLMSGTSMASPQVAGISALLEQYVKETQPDLTDSEVQSMVTAILLSTATPLSYDESTYYSPRQQGSGLANAAAAISTTAYLQVAGTSEPQAELGDDDAKTGSYTYTFDVVNFGDTNLYYNISTSVQTEGYTETDGVEYMSSTPVNLDATTVTSGSAVIYTYDYDENGAVHSHDARLAYLTLDSIPESELFRYDLTGNDGVETADVQAYLDALVGNNDIDLTAQTVRIAAGETATVTVTVQVSDAGKEYMDTHFANGIYVEGFTVLTPVSGDGVSLSLPYLAFYGDWEDAPIIDGGYYYMSEEDLAANASQYYNILWTNYAGYDDYWVPGDNPYFTEDEIDRSHISVSPNGDGYADYISDIYVSMLRNAELVTFTFTGEDGTEYTYNAAEYVEKSFYYSYYGICLPYVYSWGFDSYTPWAFTDANGDTLANNTKVTMTVAAYLTADSTEPDIWEETITVDLEAPWLDMESAVITINEDGTQTLTITYGDNVDVAAVNFVTRSGSILAQYAVDQPENQGDAVTASYDITGFGNTFYVILGDYAMNESSYQITTTDNLPVLDTSLLYGFRVNDQLIYDDTLFGWVSMSTDEENFQTTVLDSEYYIDYAITAAAYADGTIFAVAADNQLYAITPGLWDEWTWIADIGFSIRCMTFDPTTGLLYAYSSSQYALYSIDPLTGETTKVSTGYVTTIATALACDDDGTLYGITTGGLLRTMDKETGKWTTSTSDNYLNVNLTTDFKAQTGLSGTGFSYAQSMVYNAEDGCLYWAAYSYSSYYGRFGGLVRLEVNEDSTVNLTVLGTIEGNAEIVGLLKLENRGDFTIPEAEELTDLSLDPTSVSLLEGGSTTLTAILTPWYADNVNLSWSSSDEAVATVDEVGKVTATGVGQAVITVTEEASGVSAQCVVTVVNPTSQLTGYVISDNLYYQWTTFPANDLDSYEALTDYNFTDITAAEYYDGYLYAYDAVGVFYRIDPSDGYSLTKIGELQPRDEGGAFDESFSIIDMSYDYSTGFMYAIAQDLYGYSYLCTVDLLTGWIDMLSWEYLEDSYYGEAVVLAVSLDGTIYYITTTGFLCTYDLEEHYGTEIGLTGASVYSFIQSMTFDHSTGELYWAGLYGIYYVDTATGAALDLGMFDADEYGSIEIIGLHCVPDESILPELDYVDVTDVSLTADSVTVLEGMSVAVPVQILPYNATDRNMTWTVADPEIASIEDNLVTGLSAGTTTATGVLGDFEVTIEITVVASAGALNGYVLYDQSTSNGYFWGSFTDYDLSSGEALAAPDDYEAVFCGDYYDGYIYASLGNTLMKIDAETFKLEQSWYSESGPALFEMAFDYTTGTLYAVGQAGGANSDADSYLYMVDTVNGDIYPVAQSTANLYALACSEDGILYAIDTNGDLYIVDKATAELTYVGSTGYLANQYQSMAFDYDTGNLYWAQCSYDWGSGYVMDFLMVNTEDGSVTKLGTIGAAGCQVTALYSVPDKEMTVGEYTPTGVALSSTQAALSVGDTLQLTASLMPVSVSAPADATFTYTSSDESVATVDSTGLVTAVSKGSTVITVSYGDVTGTCSVTVLDDSVVFYAMYGTGFDISPMMEPGTVNTSVAYPDTMPEMVYSAYSAEDSTIYSVDADGYVWSYQYVDGEITGITQSESSILDSVTDLPSATVMDLTVNVFNNKLYAMVVYLESIYYPEDDWTYTYYGYAICEIDPDTGAAEQVGVISENIPAPQAFVFIEEDYIVVYDSYVDYIYGQSLSTDPNADVSQLAWVQSIFYFGGGKLALTYSKLTNQVYLYGEDWYDGCGLYAFDLSSYSLTRVGSTAYNTGTFDLILIE